MSDRRHHRSSVSPGELQIINRDAQRLADNNPEHYRTQEPSLGHIGNANSSQHAIMHS